MRKKTIKCLCDEIFWTLIYLLPLIAMALVTYRTGQFVGVQESMSSIGFDIVSNNVVFDTISQIFGSNGVMPLLSADILAYLSYFACAYLIHIAIDVLLFIPRYAHNLMKGDSKNA